MQRNEGATGLITGKVLFVLVAFKTKYNDLFHCSWSNSITSVIFSDVWAAYFRNTSLPKHKEPVKRQNMSSLWLLSTNPVANLVTGKMHSESNSDGLHMAMFIYCQMQVQIRRQLSTQSKPLARLRSPLLGRRQWDKHTHNLTPWNLDTTFFFGTQLPWWWKWAGIVSGQTVRSPLCPSHCISTHSLHCSLGLRPPPLFEGFLPLSFCFSDIKREEERWWVTWGKDQSRHSEKRGLTWLSVDDTKRMIYSA